MAVCLRIQVPLLIQLNGTDPDRLSLRPPVVCFGSCDPSLNRRAPDNATLVCGHPLAQSLVDILLALIKFGVMTGWRRDLQPTHTRSTVVLF